MDSTTGGFKCALYKYSLGYGFKIFRDSKTKSNLVSQSYVYYNKKSDAIEAMHDRLNMLLCINQDLFDFNKM